MQNTLDREVRANSEIVSYLRRKIAELTEQYEYWVEKCEKVNIN